MTRRAVLGCLGLTGLAGGTLLWNQRPNRWRTGFTIHLLPPSTPKGFLPGLQWILQAHLETMAPACVVIVTNPDIPIPTLRRAFQLQLQPSRQGNLLQLDFRWRRANEGWNQVTGVPKAPAQALKDFLAALPEPYRPGQKISLLPHSPELTWEILELPSIRTSLSMSVQHRSQLTNLVAMAPESALAWCLLGSSAFQEVIGKRDWIPEERILAEDCLNRALALVPGLPFAAGELAQVHSDFGNNASALEVLAHAIRIHPYSELLLRRLSYSARNAGLLEVAKCALRKRETWLGRLEGIENTLLYLGEIGRFEESLLRQAQESGWSPALKFYIGYAALVRGNTNDALRRFREAGNWLGESRFGRMGFSLWTFLEGRLQESMEALEQLVQQHLTLRTPDGEFILKLAELMALHGKADRALDLTVRAASHGFGCVQWYEKSPFLEPIRASLRFQALLHTLRERQAIQVERFPPSRFGF